MSEPDTNEAQPSVQVQIENIKEARERIMAQLGNQFKTDKVTHHHYEAYYSQFLEPLRLIDGGGILEIGIQSGASLSLWSNLFPKSFIYGIDLNIAAEGERFKIFMCDQSNLDAVQQVVKREIEHPIFLIIDDGSHIPEHQELCFDYLFSEALVPGGVYIIEDIEVSYWSRGGLYGNETRYGYRHPKSAIECFKSLVDDVNSEFISVETRALQSSIHKNRISDKARSQIQSITFGRNCIVIVKKTEQEVKNSLREYRFSRFI